MSNYIKRFVPVILVLVVCITCLVSPAAAADLTSELTSIYDLLDFVSINSDGTNFLSVDGNYTFVIPSYEYTTYYYIDTTVRISGSAADFTAKISNSLTGNSRNLTVSKIYGSLYRIYGEIPAASYRNFYLTINSNVPEKRGYTFYSFRVTSAQATAYPISCTYEVVSHQGGNEGSVDAGGYANVEIPYGDYLNYPAPGEFSASVWIHDFYNYDFITLQMGGYYVYGNTSFNVTFNGQPLPYEISYTDLDVELGDSPIQSSDGSYMVFCTIDLRGIKRTLDTTVHIDMRGIHDQSSESYFFISYVNGYVDLKEPTFFKSLLNKLASWFSNLGTWISTQTTALNANFDKNFEYLHTWINNQTNAIRDRLDLYFGQKADVADEFDEDLEDGKNELEDIIDIMDSVEKPSIESIDVSVDQYVSTADVTALTTPLSVFFTGDLFGPMIFMTILLSTVSFILFGKR